MPIYKVVTKIATMPLQSQVRMIGAKTIAQAIAYVAKDSISAERIDGREALKLAEQGIKLEEVAGE